MSHISISDTFGTTLNITISDCGERVRYYSDDLPGVHIDVFSHEDGNLSLCEADLNFSGVIGNGGGYERTMLLNIHTAPDTIHGIFSGLLS